MQKASKQELPDYFFSKALGRIKPSTGTHIHIIKRLVNKALGDIGALRIEKGKNDLPHTVFHSLSDKGSADISEGKPVVIFGYPGALHIPHEVHGQRRMALFLYCTGQNIMAFPASLQDHSSPLDPKLDFFTDFVHDESTCDPKGMSGGGVWAIPKINDGEVWAPPRAHLLGIQSGLYRERKLLRFVRIERVLDLLSMD